VDTYGITTVPAGTTITPGASQSEGAWTQIVASTARDHFCVQHSFQLNDSTMTALNYNVDIGIGAATEEAIAEDYRYEATSGELIKGPLWRMMPAFHPIASGSRLVMRVMNFGANDNGTYNVALHCVS
jgi:hypothetical protein